jgi:hypothetical protein
MSTIGTPRSTEGRGRVHKDPRPFPVRRDDEHLQPRRAGAQARTGGPDGRDSKPSASDRGSGGTGKEGELNRKCLKELEPAEGFEPPTL